MFGYLMNTLMPYLMVVLVVSVPARNRFNTVDTRLSWWNSVVGSFFS